MAEGRERGGERTLFLFHGENWFSATLEEESARRACHSRVSRVPSGEVRGEEVTGKRGEAGTAGKYTSSSRGRS